MFKVQIKHIDANDIEEPMMFDCQHVNFNMNGYQFKNIVMDNCVIEDLEVNRDEVASIRIR
ncbi:MAG: hypothetical protein ACRCX2_22980 [Paraclostridium sp.]